MESLCVEKYSFTIFAAEIQVFHLLCMSLLHYLWFTPFQIEDISLYS